MTRLSLEPDRPTGGVRVRIVHVKLKARRCAMAAALLGAFAAVVLPLLVNQDVVSAGLWMVPFAVLPLVCAGLSIYFFKTEAPQPRRVFD